MENFHSKISIIIDEELRKSGNKEFAQRRNRLIGEGVISYGVKTSEVRKITKEYWRKNQELKMAESCFKIAEELISTKVFDNQMAGIFFLGLCQEIFAKDIPRLKKLITLYLDNWATCDTISGEVVAKILKRSPEKIEVLYTWVKSRNIWLKRVALVTTVKLKNKIENWQEVASQILSFSEKEKEPIIKKAVHWLEKELF